MTCSLHGAPTFMSQCPYCLQNELDAARAEVESLRALLRDARNTVEWWTPDECNVTVSFKDALNQWFVLRDSIDAALAGKGQT